MKLKILKGDVFERLAELPEESIDLCITSPPYWGLRNYGVEGQLGAEPTMEAYLENLLRWTREVYRVLKPTGSFVLNIGDTFTGWGMKVKCTNAVNPERYACPDLKVGGGIYKPKQLLSVSSFAYCKIVSETDFVCRGEHIWAKPNVPSPIRSRLKHSHEKLFWFVKDADKYYFDPKPWMKTVQDASIVNYGKNANTTSQFADNIRLSKSSCFRKKPEKRSNDEQLRYMREKAKGKTKLETSEEFRKKHKGTAFPAGSFHKYAKKTIEHSWRVVPVGEKQSGFELAGKQPSQHIAPFPAKLIKPYILSLCPQDGVVLDPFLGSGTTMRVAVEERRNCIGVELNEEYIKYAKKRLNWNSGLGTEYEEVK